MQIYHNGSCCDKRLTFDIVLLIFNYNFSKYQKCIWQINSFDLEKKQQHTHSQEMINQHCEAQKSSRLIFEAE